MNANLSNGQYLSLINSINNSQGNPNQFAALSGVLNGSQNVVAGGNPYAGSGNLNQVIAQSNNDTLDAYNKNAVPALAAQFSQGGAFGGSAMAQAQQASQ